jgi:hypothetical protein
VSGVHRPLASRSTPTEVRRFPRRYEYKYLVDPTIVPELRSTVRLFAEPDLHAAGLPGGCYPVCSLYLDTDDLRLYRQSMNGEKTRFKLRLRSYSDTPGSTVQLEIKRRMDRLVHKRRVALGRREIDLFAEKGTNGWTQGIPAPVLRELEVFADHTRLASARPLLKVLYQREAYESRVESVRITFDTELHHAVSFDWNLQHADRRWQRTPVRGVIFEIKFTDSFPSWVQDLVRRFGLQPQSIPKYAMSIAEMLRADARGTLSRFGFSLPLIG